MNSEEDFYGLDDLFDAGWKDFVRSIRQANMKSNRRLFKIIEPIKGKSFIDSVKNLIKTLDNMPQLRISRNPSGIRLKDNRWSAIPELWIEQMQTNEGPAGYIYIQIKENRWLMIHFFKEK